jgi:hypothetical protein
MMNAYVTAILIVAAIVFGPRALLASWKAWHELSEERKAAGKKQST